MSTIHEESQARSAVYELLSLAFLYPGEGRVTSLQEGVHGAVLAVSGLGWIETETALRELSRALGSCSDDALENDYTRAFGHSVSSDCPRYEGEYGQSDVFQKSQALADLNTFYKAFGVALNPDLRDRHDHVSVEMEFVRLLTLKEAYAQRNNHGDDKVSLCRDAQHAFLERHLAPWVLIFARRLRKKAAKGVYVSLAYLLEKYMEREFKAFQLVAISDETKTHSTDVPEDEECEGDLTTAEPANAGGVS